MKKIISVLLSLSIVMCLFSACSKTAEQTPVEPKDFRVTAYVTAQSVEDMNSFEARHMDEVTDIIYIGASDFDEYGNIVVKDNFETGLNNIKSAIGDRDINLYCSITGPPAVDEHDDWYDTMADQAEHHNVAFKSGNLEGNILEFLKTFDLDGIFFDYEYAIKGKYWKVFNKFIVSLRETLGDDYKIGMALAGWDLGQNKKAREATDFIELMIYDQWDEDGKHAGMGVFEEYIKLALKAGYDLSKVDAGLAFYARPTDHGGYWFDYKDYVDKIDDNGYVDVTQDGVSMTASFNTYDDIKEKTAYAMEHGCGGVMIWHYACDVDYGNEKSLFKAINDAKEDVIEQVK